MLPKVVCDELQSRFYLAYELIRDPSFRQGWPKGEFYPPSFIPSTNEALVVNKLAEVLRAGRSRGKWTWLRNSMESGFRMALSIFNNASTKSTAESMQENYESVFGQVCLVLTALRLYLMGEDVI